MLEPRIGQTGLGLIRLLQDELYLTKLSNSTHLASMLYFSIRISKLLCWRPLEADLVGRDDIVLVQGRLSGWNIPAGSLRSFNNNVASYDEYLSPPSTRLLVFLDTNLLRILRVLHKTTP